MLVGVAILCFNGLMYMLFSPAFNLASNDQWHTLKPGARIGMPTAVALTWFVTVPWECLCASCCMQRQMHEQLLMSRNHVVRLTDARMQVYPSWCVHAFLPADLFMLPQRGSAGTWFAEQLACCR